MVTLSLLRVPTWRCTILALVTKWDRCRFGVSCVRPSSGTGHQVPELGTQCQNWAYCKVTSSPVPEMGRPVPEMGTPNWYSANLRTWWSQCWNWSQCWHWDDAKMGYNINIMPKCFTFFHFSFWGKRSINPHQLEVTILPHIFVHVNVIFSNLAPLELVQTQSLSQKCLELEVASS